MNIGKIRNIFRSTDERSSLVKKNMLISLVTKVIALATSFVIVPVTLHFLDAEIYGVWLTISSILYWVSFFNIGLGNGMRNYVSMSYSKGDYKLSSQYISTTIFLLTIIAGALGLVTAIVLPNINMQSLFNTSSSNESILFLSLLLAIMMTLMLFVVRIIGNLFCALQLSAVNEVLGTLGNVVSLAIVCAMAQWTDANLLWIVAAYTIPPVVIFTLAFFPTFHIYKNIRPSFHAINLSLSKSIVGKSLGFFVIQITSCLVIYGSSNIFISQYCGPTEVTRYGIAYKFFNLLTIAYLIYITPMWNAYTDAYVRGDTAWIQRVFSKSLRVWMLMSAGGVVMVFFSNCFYHLWIGDTVEIPWTLSAITCAYLCAFNLNSCLTAPINGLNKIRVQVVTSVVLTAIYLILVNIFGSILGIYGIIGSMALCYLLMALIHYYQCWLLINNKATGIWNK